MPALSQNLIFKVTNGNTTTNTVQVTYPENTSSALTLVSEPVKGDGYFDSGDGLHTVFWKITQFVGSIEVQSTLESNPTDSDWFTVKLGDTSVNYTVDTTGLISAYSIEKVQYFSPNSVPKSYNFIGNFVWIRGKISNWTQGTVNAISVNR
jgi:hypothetical protein